MVKNLLDSPGCYTLHNVTNPMMWLSQADLFVAAEILAGLLVLQFFDVSSFHTVATPTFKLELAVGSARGIEVRSNNMV